MTMIKIGGIFAIVGALALVSCTERAPQIASGDDIIAQTDDINAFATRVLGGIQPASITQEREFCGYIYEMDDGGLAATAPARGGEDYCDLPAPDETVLASYHSHGGYSEDYDNEVPSVDDMVGDFEAGIDGYIGTPAGRVWLVDYEGQIARQLCGVACVTADPDDDPENADPVPQTFTLEELEARFE